MVKATRPTRQRLGTKELFQLIRDQKRIIDEKKQERLEVGSDITLARETLANAGIPKEAADMAFRYATWDDDKRAGFDVAYAIVREAIGLPMEDELFDAQGRPNVHIPEPEEKKPVGRPPKDKSAKGKAKEPAPAQPEPVLPGTGTAAEGIAATVLEDAAKATGRPTLN